MLYYTKSLWFRAEKQAKQCYHCCNVDFEVIKTLSDLKFSLVRSLRILQAKALFGPQI